MHPHPSTHRGDPVGRPHLARLRAIVRSRMWKWVFDSYRVLGVAVEALDEHLIEIAPSRDGRGRRERFERARSALPHVFGEALSRATPFVISGGGVTVACAPIVAAGTLAGVVAMASAERAAFDECDLRRMAVVLADAISDQLSRPSHEHGGALNQILALYQLLQGAIATGSEPQAIRTAAEALSIWEELELLAYRADLDGRYARLATLPGSDPAGAPHALEYRFARNSPAVVRLAAEDRAALGFRGGGDTMLARLTTDGGSWLIALNATRAPVDGARAELYLALLGHALNGCVAVETSRLTWALTHRFVETDPPQEAARRAFDEMAHALNAAGCFAVYRGDGSPALVAGDRSRVGDARSPIADGSTLRAIVPGPAPFKGAIELHAIGGASFTRRDARLFAAAVASFGAWLPSAVRRLGPGEPRGAARSFDQIVERYAREAQASNDAASLILISADDRALSLDTTHAWIKRLRPQLRPTDLAGRFASGELGILLLQTPAAGAQVVARRLSRLLGPPLAGLASSLRIGIASPVDDVVSAAALIERARLQPIDPRAAARS